MELQSKSYVVGVRKLWSCSLRFTELESESYGVIVQKLWNCSLRMVELESESYAMDFEIYGVGV